MFLEKVFDSIKNNIKFLEKLTRHQATSVIEWEKSELENIFLLLIFGPYIGLPGIPTHITFELLPYMEKELIQMVNKVQTASGPISELFSNLNIG